MTLWKMKDTLTTHSILFLLFTIFTFNSAFSQSSAQKLRDFQYLEEALDLFSQKLDQTLEELSFDETLHPAHTDPETGKWVALDRNEWTSGYFAGSLWMMYQLTGNTKWRDYARQWTNDMESTAYTADNHDTGLRIYGSFGKGYQITNDLQYRKIVLQGAYSLSQRFDPTIGAIKSWEPWEKLNASYPVIIDNMMNLELLFLAAELTGKTEWHNIANTHARTTQKTHMREDGSFYHIVDFDMNGNINRKFTTQGYDANSVWARGQAWAIYGYTMAYRYTQLPEFLDAAVSASNFFIDHLPEDHIPWYDFKEPAIPNTTKDASAAAVAASGLIELYSFTDNTLYFNQAVDILNSLMSNGYSSKNSADSSVLLRSTRHRGDEERGTVYSDYYFIEAIKRYKTQMDADFPELASETPFYLEQNYPNPFNSHTQFYYSVEEAANIEIELFNLAGKKVRTIFSGTREPGNYQLQVDGSNLSSGLYIYRFRMNNRVESKKMLLVK